MRSVRRARHRAGIRTGRRPGQRPHARDHLRRSGSAHVSAERGRSAARLPPGPAVPGRHPAGAGRTRVLRSAGTATGMHRAAAGGHVRSGRHRSPRRRRDLRTSRPAAVLRGRDDATGRRTARSSLLRRVPHHDRMRNPARRISDAADHSSARLHAADGSDLRPGAGGRTGVLRSARAATGMHRATARAGQLPASPGSRPRRDVQRARPASVPYNRRTRAVSDWAGPDRAAIDLLPGAGRRTRVLRQPRAAGRLHPAERPADAASINHDPASVDDDPASGVIADQIAVTARSEAQPPMYDISLPLVREARPRPVAAEGPASPRR